MAGTTARLSLPFPQLTDAADIAQAVPPLTTLLDTIAVAYAKGLLSARPAASSTQLGRLYYATDNGITYFCDGTTWQRLDLDALNRIIALEAKIPTGPSSFRAERATPVAFSNGPTLQLAWQTLQHALNSFSAVGTSTWTIPVTGLYDYALALYNTSNSATAVHAGLYNTTGPTAIDATDSQVYPNGSGLMPPIIVAGIRTFTAGDVLAIYGASTGGASSWFGNFQMKLNRV